MKASQVIAGYSGAGADKLRKIMGKKLPEEMAKERGKFVEGCVATVACTPEWAGLLFDKIEGFAGYGFNKSHSVEYTLISYQAMYLKTHYPVEFFAAALSLMPQDKLPGLMKDAERMGIEVDLPDINHSSGQFEIVTDTRLVMPFNRIKGILALTTEAILKARNDGSGPFTSKENLSERVERRRCNVKHVGLLDTVGAFADIEPGQLPRKHPDRIKDQRDLIPGLITAYVPINREMHRDRDTRVAILQNYAEYAEKFGPASLADLDPDNPPDGMPIKPCTGKNMRFMVIVDAASKGEDASGQFSYVKDKVCVSEWVQEALDENDLSRADGYWTGLIKRPKSGKQVTAAEIAAYAPYLQREIELLQPTCIVLLGSTTVRQFIPGFAGKASEVAGEVVYNKDLDCNLVIGFAPGEIYHEPSKQAKLNEVFAVAAQLTQG